MAEGLLTGAAPATPTRQRSHRFAAGRRCQGQPASWFVSIGRRRRPSIERSSPVKNLPYMRSTEPKKRIGLLRLQSH